MELEEFEELEELEPLRAQRRRLTETVAAHRRALHLAHVHSDDAGDCVCARAATYFAKRTPLGCGCRRRCAGAPKCGTGCWSGDLRRAVRSRIDGRRFAAAVLAGRLDPDALTPG